MRLTLGRLERDKVTMHKSICSLVDGLILEITQKEFSREKKSNGLKEERYIEKH